MRRALLGFFLLLVCMPAFSAERAYVLDIHYSKGLLELNDVFVGMAFIPAEEKTGVSYLAKVEDFEGEELDSRYFFVPTIKLGDRLDGNEMKGEMEELNDLNFLLYLPYFENGKSVEISDSAGSLILEVGVAMFADACGDGTCQEHESPESCAEDCEKIMETKKTFELKACADKECEQRQEAFDAGETVFVDFESSESGLKVSALVVSPDSKEQEIELPGKFVAELEGEYIVDASAELGELEGEKILSFSVIGAEEPAGEEGGFAWEYAVLALAGLLVLAGLILLVYEKKKNSGNQSLEMDL